jgi:hypothetical protein
MKLLDIIKEDVRYFKKEEPSEEKRVKTIFKALRNGVVKVPHPRTNNIIKFRYHISDNIFYRWENYMSEKCLTIITSNFPEEGITIYCDDKDVIDMCTNNTESISKNPTGIHLREMFMNKLKNRFNKFQVSFYVNKQGMKFVLEEPTELINENEEDDRIIKKVGVIFKALNKKMYRKNKDFKYYFILPDNFNVLLNDTPEIERHRQLRREYDFLYVQVGNDGENNNVKFYYKKEGDDELNRLNIDTVDQYNYNLFFVNEKLKPFNIKLIYKNRVNKWE